MKVDIINRQNKIRLNKKSIIRSTKFVLRNMGKNNAVVSLMFTDDSYIRKLNGKYRNVNSKTDVLAFPMQERDILGDIVISAETAKREADNRKIAVHKEIFLYLVHGLLHLLGYGDKEEEDRIKMNRKQEELLEAM